MQYPVIVRPEATDQYVAQPLGIPELRVVASTEAEAVARVSQALDQWLASAKIIQVVVSGAKSGNPWLNTFGRSANDPDFDEFLEELQQIRSADATE